MSDSASKLVREARLPLSRVRKFAPAEQRSARRATLLKTVSAVGVLAAVGLFSVSMMTGKDTASEGAEAGSATAALPAPAGEQIAAALPSEEPAVTSEPVSPSPDSAATAGAEITSPSDPADGGEVLAAAPADEAPSTSGTADAAAGCMPDQLEALTGLELAPATPSQLDRAQDARLMELVEAVSRCPDALVEVRSYAEPQRSSLETALASLRQARELIAMIGQRGFDTARFTSVGVGDPVKDKLPDGTHPAPNSIRLVVKLGS